VQLSRLCINIGQQGYENYVQGHFTSCLPLPDRLLKLVTSRLSFREALLKADETPLPLLGSKVGEEGGRGSAKTSPKSSVVKSTRFILSTHSCR